MKDNGKKKLLTGSIFIILFIIWTILIQVVDKQPLGQNGTDIGFATFNCWFHKLTGANMTLYTITDWLGLVPIFVCMIFAGIGLFQLIKRKSLFKVDSDIIILGVYYVVVIICNMIFGIFDMLSVMLIFLPLYPNTVDGYIYSVNLFNYTETTSFNRIVYWFLFLSLILLGCVKTALTQFNIEKGQRILAGFSMGLSILTVLFLSMAKEPYAVTVEFLLFVIKGILLFKYCKNTKKSSLLC